MKLPKAPIRNPYALGAKMRSGAGFHKHRTAPQGGAVNEGQAYLNEYAEELEAEVQEAIADSCVECDGPGARLRWAAMDDNGEPVPVPGQSEMLCGDCYEVRERFRAGSRTTIRILVDDCPTLLNE